MSQIDNLGPYGLLHSVKIPHTESNFQGLHDVCANTSCHLSCHDVTNDLTEQEKALVVQNCPMPLTQRVYMTKGPDGLILHDANGRFFSALRAKSMYLPSHVQVPPYELLSQVMVPGQGKPLPLCVSMDNSVCDVNTISRMSPFDHIKAKLQCFKKLDNKPRVIFASNDLGSLSGTILKGPESNLLKESFLGLHDYFQQHSEDGAGILDRKLKLVPEISKQLMLKNLDGNVSLQRCLDGIVGVRKRKSDGGNTLIFVVKSDDFHKQSPTPNGQVQIFKMDYNKKKKNRAKRRITFLNHPHDIRFLSPEFKERGVVHADMTVQDILNHLEHVFRHEELNNIGCDQFHHYVELLQAYEQNLPHNDDDN